MDKNDRGEEVIERGRENENERKWENVIVRECDTELTQTQNWPKGIEK